jgi:hypothetical protein
VNDTTTAKVFYWPEFAAQGGPPPDGPVISPHTFLADTAAAVSLVFLETEDRWAVMDSDGNVFAEATNPGHLADWWNDFLATLGQMFEDGEL